jgi:hypothetical protein
MEEAGAMGWSRERTEVDAAIALPLLCHHGSTLQWDAKRAVGCNSGLEDEVFGLTKPLARQRGAG